MRDRTAITIDPATGMAWRDGKILGRRNWEVHTETSITIKDQFIVKAASEDEAILKGQEIAERKHKKEDPNAWVEITAAFTDG